MRTILLLAEKPDQAKKYANALGTPKKTDTGWDVYSEQLSAQVLVRPAVGHLVERSNPWTNFENWESVERLPMFPDHFDFEIKKNTKKNFNAIKNAIRTVDSIMIGTDPDREGEAVKALELLSDRATITQVSSEKKSKTAPKLYNLTDIQAEMSKLYKFDADRTKSIIQSLYQKGYMSYPRTNSNLITTNEFDYLIEHIDDYQAAIGKTIETPNRSPRKSFVNDKKVVEHYAIIPTEIIPDMEELEKEERLIYQMVTFRTLLMFAPDYEYTSTSITLDNNGQEFKTTGSVTLSKGWQVYLPSQSKEQVLPPYQEGQEIAVERQLKEDATKPPQRITENSLLKKWLPKYSLGTPATRDAMIKSVQDKGYITKDKKSGQLFPTERGILLIHYLDKLNIAYTNPETTGKWETALAKIGEGKMKKEDFVAKVRLAITKQIERGKEIG